MTTSEPANKAEFQEHLRAAWADLQATLDDLSEAQMTELTDNSGWTVKDHLAHLVVWEQGITALLRQRPRWEAMGVDVDLANSRLVAETEDALNEVMRERTLSLSLARVREDLRRSHEELSMVVESLAADELLKGYSSYQPDEPGEDSGEPVLGWVVGNSSGHYLEHLPWIRELAGA